MTRPSSRWWWDLSAREFAALDLDGTVAILPVAAVEQHGPHLPVRVDAAINEGILRRAVELMPDELPALVMPAMPVGKSNEHLAFKGTLSLSHDTLARLWLDLARSAHRSGIRKLIFFNSHGGQPQVMEIVCRELRVELGMLAVACSWFHLVEIDDLFSATEQRHGIHAGAIETSLMLHLHPELVTMSEAANFEPSSVAIERDFRHLTAEGGISFGWQAQDLHPTGACGDATKADAATGAELLERVARALVDLVADVAAFPLHRLTARTAFDGS